MTKVQVISGLNTVKVWLTCIDKFGKVNEFVGQGSPIYKLEKKSFLQIHAEKIMNKLYLDTMGRREIQRELYGCLTPVNRIYSLETREEAVRKLNETIKTIQEM